MKLFIVLVNSLFVVVALATHNPLVMSLKKKMTG